MQQQLDGTIIYLLLILHVILLKIVLLCFSLVNLTFMHIQITCTVPEATIKNVSKAGRYALRILARNCLGWSVPSEWRLMDPCWHVDEEVRSQMLIWLITKEFIVAFRGFFPLVPLSALISTYVVIFPDSSLASHLSRS